jgi:hypothetical protein
VWNRACQIIGMAGIDAGVDPHTVMKWSGHRTESMLRRYHIIDLDDRGGRGSARATTGGRRKTSSDRNSAEPAQNSLFSRPRSEAGIVRS